MGCRQLHPYAADSVDSLNYTECEANGFGVEEADSRLALVSLGACDVVAMPHAAAVECIATTSAQQPYNKIVSLMFWQHIKRRVERALRWKAVACASSHSDLSSRSFRSVPVASMRSTVSSMTLATSRVCASTCRRRRSRCSLRRSCSRSGRQGCGQAGTVSTGAGGRGGGL